MNALPGGTGTTTKDRALSVDALAGGFQNILPEETLAPISISSNTSSLGLSAINGRLAKIRLGGGAGDDLFSNAQIGFFINGIGGFGETDQTLEQNASDFETKGVISGFDYRVTDNLIVGIAGSYSNFELDFDQREKGTINVILRPFYPTLDEQDWQKEEVVLIENVKNFEIFIKVEFVVFHYINLSLYLFLTT